jgi:hypothetical protein
MQASIALTCLLIPPLLPLGLFGWWRGLQFYAPDALRGRDALRTVSMGSGLASVALLIGLVVGVGPSPEALGLTAEYQQWAANDDILTALAGPTTAVANLLGGIPAVGLALIVTVVVCLAAPILVALAASAYADDSSAVRRLLAGLVLVGAVGLANLPIAYLPQPWGLGAAAGAAAWVGWVVVRGHR